MKEDIDKTLNDNMREIVHPFWIIVYKLKIARYLCAFDDLRRIAKNGMYC